MKITEEDFSGMGWNTPEEDNPVGCFQRPLLQSVVLVGHLLIEIRDLLEAIEENR